MPRAGELDGGAARAGLRPAWRGPTGSHTTHLWGPGPRGSAQDRVPAQPHVPLHHTFISLPQLRPTTSAQEAFLAAPWLSVCTDTGPELPLGLSWALPGHVSRQLSHCAVTGSLTAPPEQVQDKATSHVLVHLVSNCLWGSNVNSEYQTAMTTERRRRGREAGQERHVTVEEANASFH